MINRTYRPVVTIHDEREAARHARGFIAIIDDDEAIREAVKTLLDLEGYATETYASVMHYVDFLQRNEPCFPGPRCILLDVKMPEQTGLELQNRLNALSDKTPLVFMSGGSGAQEAVQALKNGAIDSMRPHLVFERSTYCNISGRLDFDHASGFKPARSESWPASHPLGIEIGRAHV